MRPLRDIYRAATKPNRGWRANRTHKMRRSIADHDTQVIVSLLDSLIMPRPSRSK